MRIPAVAHAVWGGGPRRRRTLSPYFVVVLRDCSPGRQGVGRSLIRHRHGRIGSLWAWATTALNTTVNAEKGVLCRSP